MDKIFLQENNSQKKENRMSSGPLKNAKFGRTHVLCMAHKDDVEIQSEKNDLEKVASLFQ